ncbi:MAG: hypothetical protein HY043_18195 [Verrucomicrobia bacterium]|nr:hypothetical protein [Verrucomicrobiota bacterium]
MKLELIEPPSMPDPNGAELCELAREMVAAAAVLRTKYLALCDWITKHQPTPKMVTNELSAAGVRTQQIAEVKRVCFTSTELYQDFVKRFVGFKVALSRERAKKREGEEALQYKWNRLLSTFEKLTHEGPPPMPYHSANGVHLFVWSDEQAPPAEIVEPPVLGGWRLKEKPSPLAGKLAPSVTTGNTTIFTIPGWRITVEREQPKSIRTKKKKYHNEKRRTVAENVERRSAAGG